MDNKNDITMIRMSYNNNTIVIQLNSNAVIYFVLRLYFVMPLLSNITCEQQFRRIFHIFEMSTK